MSYQEEITTKALLKQAPSEKGRAISTPYVPATNHLQRAELALSPLQTPGKFI
jgi:hypothetical protein